MQIPSRITIRRWYCSAALAAAALVSSPARAAIWQASPDCSSSSSSLGCRLAGVLSLLYVAAAVLAVVLVLVIVLAVRSHRRRSGDGKGLR